MPRLAAVVVLGAGMLLADSAPRLRAQEPPLPAREPFFEAVRENLARAGRLQDAYAYKERRTELHMNPFGRVGTDGTVVYDVTPLRPGPGFMRRVIERDGKPVTNGSVERFGTRRQRDQAQSSPSIQDTMNVLEFAIDRREYVGGRPVVVVSFTPRREASPKTRAGKLARVFRGEVWVDEEAHEVMRVEATAIDSISYGFGLIARLGEGTRATLVREQVGDLWLPVSIRLVGQGRAVLFRKLNVDFAIEWFDYRKVTDPAPPAGEP